MSKYYDVLGGRFETKYQDIGLQKLNVKEGETVLEIGFGTGHCVLALAESVGISGKVYGIDISEGMLRKTHSRVERAGLSERVVLRRSDATRLLFENELFDAVFMSFTLELFNTQEFPVILHECRRVLMKGGRICVVSLAKREKPIITIKVYEWIHQRFSKYIDCRPIFVQRVLEESGLQIIDKIKLSMWGLPVEIVLAKKQ
ncbi:methyltransferase domain-containing protein [bacterium]|nr:methyltransferase domain-containing protein [bacterium]